MQFITSALALGALATAAFASEDAATKKYYLKTSVKSGYTSFNNLYLTAYHSGAGLNDAVFLPTKSEAAVGYLVKTNSTAKDGHSFYNQQFNFTGSDYPYELVMSEGTDTYAAWEPTYINLGSLAANGNSPYSGFWLNSSGLQWTDYPQNPTNTGFDGWLVCQWWRGVPQLFFRLRGFDQNITVPSSCAEVNLLPEYV